MSELYQKWVLFLSCKRCKKDTIFGAAQTNFRPFLFYDRFSIVEVNLNFKILWNVLPSDWSNFREKAEKWENKENVNIVIITELWTSKLALTFICINFTHQGWPYKIGHLLNCQKFCFFKSPIVQWTLISTIFFLNSALWFPTTDFDMKAIWVNF